MSHFRELYASYLNGTASFESAEVPLPVTPDPAKITEEDVQEVRQLREAVETAEEVVYKVEEDSKFLNASNQVTEVVHAAIDGAEKSNPAIAEAFVGVANLAIGDASKILGTEIPKLSNLADGSVDTVSMEALTDWTEAAHQAFKAAVEKYYTELSEGWERLDTNLSDYECRAGMIASKQSSRQGTGGKAIQVSNHILEHLVYGTGYSPNLVSGVQEIFHFAREFSQILDEYRARVVKGDLTTVDDLLAKAELLEKRQPERLMGNRRFDEVESDVKCPTNFMFLPMLPDAAQVVRDGDGFRSLTPDQVQAVIEPMRKVASDLRILLTEQRQVSGQSLIEVIRSAVEGSESGVAALRRLNALTGELALICARQMHYIAKTSAAVNAVLTVAEESLFQD